MGCGVVIDDKKLSTRLPDETPVYIYATKNGKVIHVQGDIIPEDGYYPTISFFEKGINLHTKSIFAGIFYLFEELFPLTAPQLILQMHLNLNFFWNFIHILQDSC